VIGYYLQRPAEVDEYLRREKLRATMMRQQTEARFDPQGIRDRLLARTTA